MYPQWVSTVLYPCIYIICILTVFICSYGDNILYVPFQNSQFKSPYSKTYLGIFTLEHRRATGINCSSWGGSKARKIQAQGTQSRALRMSARTEKGKPEGISWKFFQISNRNNSENMTLTVGGISEEYVFKQLSMRWSRSKGMCLQS